MTGKGLTIVVKAENDTDNDPTTGMDIATFNVSIADAGEVRCDRNPQARREYLPHHGN